MYASSAASLDIPANNEQNETQPSDVNVVNFNDMHDCLLKTIRSKRPKTKSRDVCEARELFLLAKMQGFLLYQQRESMDQTAFGF